MSQERDKCSKRSLESHDQAKDQIQDMKRRTGAFSCQSPSLDQNDNRKVRETLSIYLLNTNSVMTTRGSKSEAKVPTPGPGFFYVGSQSPTSISMNVTLYSARIIKHGTVNVIRTKLVRWAVTQIVLEDFSDRKCHSNKTRMAYASIFCDKWRVFGSSDGLLDRFSVLWDVR